MYNKVFDSHEENSNFLSILLFTHSLFAAVPEQYVREVERISAQYNADMKFFCVV